MKDARETLHSWLHRPLFLAMVAAALSTLLLLAGSLFVVMQQTQQRESEQMNAQGERFPAEAGTAFRAVARKPR